MKKLLILILVTLFFSSCHSVITQTDEGEVVKSTTISSLKTITSMSENSETYHIQRDIAGKFFLDQSPEEFLNALNQENIELHRYDNEPADEISGFFPIKDGRSYNYDGSFGFETDDIQISYDSHGIAFSIYVTSRKYVSEKGLCVGDTKAKMITLYGKNFRKEDAYSGHEYTDGERFFVISIEKNTVTAWGIASQAIGMDQP